MQDVHRSASHLATPVIRNNLFTAVNFSPKLEEFEPRNGAHLSIFAKSNKQRKMVRKTSDESVATYGIPVVNPEVIANRSIKSLGYEGSSFSFVSLGLMHPFSVQVDERISVAPLPKVPTSSLVR
jgi:hypothetical protein